MTQAFKPLSIPSGLVIVSRPDPERSTRGNRRVPLNGSQFPERSSNGSQGIWHPSTNKDTRHYTQPIWFHILRNILTLCFLPKIR